MAKNVNIFYSNWTNTGEKVQVDKWTVDFRIEWQDYTGQAHSWEGVVTFPNDLALVPAKWLKEEMLDLILRAARKKLNVDPDLDELDLDNISFIGGFENDLYQYPEAVNNWHDPQPYPTGDRLTRVNSPVRKGNYALRVEVRSGDDYGWSGERAELYGMYGGDGLQIYENESSGTQFYAISIYLPSDWSPPVTNDPWEPYGVFMQLHGPDVLSASPSFSLNVLNTYFVHMHSGDADDLNNPSVANIEKYDCGSVVLNGWVDFIFKVKWAKTFTGEVEVWRRNPGADFVKVVSVADIPTLVFKSSVGGGVVGNHYWKTGFYRSTEPDLTNVVYLDCHTRGLTFKDVNIMAFGEV